MAILCVVVQQWSECRLHSLAVSNNDFTTLSACKLVDALNGPQAILKTLNLSHNCLNDELATCMGQTLKVCAFFGSHCMWCVSLHVSEREDGCV